MKKQVVGFSMCVLFTASFAWSLTAGLLDLRGPGLVLAIVCAVGFIAGLIMIVSVSTD